MGSERRNRSPPNPYGPEPVALRSSTIECGLSDAIADESRHSTSVLRGSRRSRSRLTTNLPGISGRYGDPTRHEQPLLRVNGDVMRGFWQESRSSPSTHLPCSPARNSVGSESSGDQPPTAAGKDGDDARAAGPRADRTSYWQPARHEAGRRRKPIERGLRGLGQTPRSSRTVRGAGPGSPRDEGGSKIGFPGVDVEKGGRKRDGKDVCASDLGCAKRQPTPERTRPDSSMSLIPQPRSRANPPPEPDTLSRRRSEPAPAHRGPIHSLPFRVCLLPTP